jgi:glycine/D-amino acid oxidase-like deaminating enzyme/nitrite reductase/ring-hydroxylating ferredoxin subunit
MENASYWLARRRPPRFGSLRRDLAVDVAIVGGGVTGITAAYLLKRAGARVALLERGIAAAADSGHTTAHLTTVPDLRLQTLVKRFGRDSAHGIWNAGMLAIEQIGEVVATERLDCDFRRVPGYLMTSLEDSAHEEQELKELREDELLARSFGALTEVVERVPHFGKPGVRFDQQAKFHPIRYLDGLLERISGGGSHVFQQSEVTEFAERPLRIRACGHEVRCDFLLIATHTPLTGNTATLKALALQTKLPLYTSYVIGARIPAGTLPQALFWDTSDPYYYIRSELVDGDDYVIFGGRDHKTGQEKDPEAVFTELGQALRLWFPHARPVRRWMGQVIESTDGLPFIGETAERQFVATGYAGNGYTFGTLAALLARDAFLGLPNPWQELLDVHRRKAAGALRFLSENADFPYHLVKDRLQRAEPASPDQLAEGEGKVLSLDGRKVAAYRRPGGELVLLSPVCTHLKCLVRWNGADQTWDCPCHGSRFHPTGEVFSGPAEAPLAAFDHEPSIPE